MSTAEPKLQPRVGIGVLIFKGNEVLVGKRKGSSGSGTFALPGGHLEFQEGLVECAGRETLEETGLRIINTRVEWVENCIWAGVHYVTIFMRAELAYQDDEAKVMEPDKCDHWQWTPWPNIPQPVFHPLQQLLDSSYQPLISI